MSTQSNGTLAAASSKSGNGENVTFPGRPCTNTKGEKKTVSFIHGGDAASMSQLRHVVLEAYREAKQAAAIGAQFGNQRGACGRPLLLTSTP
jgi:hypothetical protein